MWGSETCVQHGSVSSWTKKVFFVFFSLFNLNHISIWLFSTSLYSCLQMMIGFNFKTQSWSLSINFLMVKRPQGGIHKLCTKEVIFFIWSFVLTSPGAALIWGLDRLCSEGSAGIWPQVSGNIFELSSCWLQVLLAHSLWWLHPVSTTFQSVQLYNYFSHCSVTQRIDYTLWHSGPAVMNSLNSALSPIVAKEIPPWMKFTIFIFYHLDLFYLDLWTQYHHS